MRYNLDTLMNTLHMKGLNYRHIGVIYGLSDSQHLRRILLSVAAARCAKIEIKEIMRAKMKEIMTPTEERKTKFHRFSPTCTAFKAVIAKFLNQLSGRSKNSLLYWRRDLCRQLRDWFQVRRNNVDNGDIISSPSRKKRSADSTSTLAETFDWSSTS